MKSFFFTLTISLVVSVVAAVFVTNWSMRQAKSTSLSATISLPTPLPSLLPLVASSSDVLQKRVESLEKEVATLKEVVSTNKTPSKKTEATAAVSKRVNQVIYLGSDSTAKREWTETGISLEIDSADYPAGTKVEFQAGLQIVGGEAWARLVNKTTGAIISVSEVSHNTDMTTWKGSPTFELHSGKNTYTVQIRSTSGETAYLRGSRLIFQ